MKSKILLLTLTVFANFVLFAQPYTETFESYSTCNTSFTLGGITFSGTTLRVWVPNQCGAASLFGLGVGTSCSAESCGGTSDKFLDSYTNSGTGLTYSISTSGASGTAFALKSMFVYISTNSGTTPTTGSVVFTGKKGGSTVFTFTKTSWTNGTNGFSFVDFATEGGSDNSRTPIDAIQMTASGSINYLAVDNFKIMPATAWVGGTSSNPTVSSNWSDGLPSANTTVQIKTGTFAPTISGTLNAYDFRIVPGASATVTGTLNVAGTLSNSGTLTASSGTVVFNGNSAQTIAANTFSSNTIKNLTINNSSGVTLGGTLNVTGTFTPTTGTFITGGYLTLKSTSITSTAIVGVVGGSISGNVKVERYIPAKRAFRLLAPGVTTSTSINANWQEGVSNPNTSTNNNPNSGYGTHITGGTSANGFDATVTNSASMFTFNSSTQTWTSAANTNSTTLSATTGYRILIRGDRSISLNTNSPTPTNTTLRATGTLTTGTVSFTGLASTTNNYTLLGNPYWAPVDWTAVSRTNLATTYWIWDPTITGTNGRGGYTSFTRTGVGTGTTSGGGSINKNIQPGQAFFVQTSGASPALSFAESNKDISTALTSTFRSQNNNSSGTNGLYTVKLFLEENYAQGLMADAITLAFSNQFTNSKDEFDAAKLDNLDERISFRNGKDLFGMESRAMPTGIDTAYIQVSNMLSTNYVLEVEGKDFDANSIISAYLVDNYLKTTTQLSNTSSVHVPYVIDNNPASAEATRFMIVTSKKVFPTLVSVTDIGIKISPNPSTDVAIISYSAKAKGNTTIRVVNSNGQVVANIGLGEQQSGQYNLAVSKFSSGQYTIEVVIGEEKITTQFIKQ